MTSRQGESAEKLSALLQLDREIIGTWVGEIGSFERAGRPAMACQAIDFASRGQLVEVRASNSPCFGGRYHLGLEAAPAWRSSFVVLEEKLFGSERAAVAGGKKVCTEVAGNRAVLLGPLGSCAEDPKLVTVVCLAEQAMRITGLVAYSRGASDLRTRFASACHMAIEAPLVTNDICLSLIDTTSRRYCQFRPEELILALPYALFLEAVENIDASVCGRGRPEYARIFPDPPVNTGQNAASPGTGLDAGSASGQEEHAPCKR